MNTRIKKAWLLITGLALATLLLAACSGAPPPADPASEESATGEHMDAEQVDELMDEEEHMDEAEHGHVDLPHEYEGFVNPFTGDAEAIAAGAELYAINCASCHGETGMGDGAAAAALEPRPASLADSEMMHDMSDAYLFWRISEGGVIEPFNSAMPPWKDVFSEEQRWQLANFVRTLSQ